MKIHSKLYYILIGVFISLLCMLIGVIWIKPLISKQGIWSIGIYMGESPFSLNNPTNIKNPVLTAKDVTDVPATFVADPFIIKKDSTWFMFFEVFNDNNHQGDIGVAISEDGLNWKYKQIVLDEPFHLSFPYVFKWNNEYYMIPESNEANSIRLYRAKIFPFQWSYVGNLLNDYDFLDTSIVRYHGKWWLFTTTSMKNHYLRLFYADDLKGPWKEHIKSPIVRGNAHIARSGGRMFLYNDHIIRYAQDDDPTYGKQIWAFKITELTTTTYKEEKVSDIPIIKASGTGWNKNGMHQIDPYQVEEKKWIACVDGKVNGLVLKLTKNFEIDLYY